MSISFILHKYWLNCGLIRCFWIGWNGLVWIGMILINVNRVGIFVIPNFRIFAPKSLIFQIIFALRIFKMLVASKVFTFNFFCSMTRIAPSDESWSPSEKVEFVVVSCNVIPWDHGHDGSLWVHSSALINILPRSGNISTTIQNPEGGLVLITVSRSGWLVEVGYGWLISGVYPIFYMGPEWVRGTYQELYGPSYFSQQRYLSRLFRTHHQIPNDAVSKHNGR